MGTSTIRGIITPEHDILAWNAEDMVHIFVVKYYKLESKKIVTFYAANRGIVQFYVDTSWSGVQLPYKGEELKQYIRDNRNVKHMVGNKELTVEVEF